MFCTNCGEKLPDDALFCTSCGERIQPATASPFEAQSAASAPSAQQEAGYLGATVPMAATQFLDADRQAAPSQFEATAPMTPYDPAGQNAASVPTATVPQPMNDKRSSSSRTPLVIAVVCLAVAVVALVFVFVVMPALFPSDSNTAQTTSSTAATSATQAQDDSSSTAASESSTPSSSSSSTDSDSSSASSSNGSSSGSAGSSSTTSNDSAGSSNSADSSSSASSGGSTASSGAAGSSSSSSTSTGDSAADIPASPIALSLADAGNYHDINLFLSNFAEVNVDELDTNDPDDEKFTLWAIIHLFINREDLIEVNTQFRYQLFNVTQDGSKDDVIWDTRTSEANLYNTASKYFDFDFTVPPQPNDDPAEAYLTNGGYVYWTTTGGNPRSGFAISTNLTDLGNNRYAVDFEIHGNGNSEIATATNQLPSLTPEQALDYDLGPVINGTAIIRVSGSSANPSFVLEYYKRQV